MENRKIYFYLLNVFSFGVIIFIYFYDNLDWLGMYEHIDRRREILIYVITFVSIEMFILIISFLINHVLYVSYPKSNGFMRIFLSMIVAVFLCGAFVSFLNSSEGASSVPCTVDADPSTPGCQ
jgi:hypothetical protein